MIIFESEENFASVVNENTYWKPGRQAFSRKKTVLIREIYAFTSWV